jgi:hypothetical protein
MEGLDEIIKVLAELGAQAAKAPWEIAKAVAKLGLGGE